MAARPITDDPHDTLRRDRGNPVGYGRNQGIGVLGWPRKTLTLGVAPRYRIADHAAEVPVNE
jgi:hypothetical protein